MPTFSGKSSIDNSDVTITTPDVVADGELSGADVQAMLASFVRVVNFGTNASFPRPDGALPGSVYWRGTGAVVPTAATAEEWVYLP